MTDERSETGGEVGVRSKIRKRRTRQRLKESLGVQVVRRET